MEALAPWTEPFQQFHEAVKEQFWADLYLHTRQVWLQFLERHPVEANDRRVGLREYEGAGATRRPQWFL
ncbi:MAG: hypothetical protein ABI945_03825 [Nitrospirales bacterium]